MASDSGDKNLLLGKAVAVSERYAPDLLYPIPRSEARDRLGLDATALPFSGEDIWHAYELSWLDGRGRPEAFVGRFRIPADSPNLVESKSFKLYLNSLNHESFASQEEAAARICADIGQVAGAAVKLEMLAVDDPALAGKALPGDSLDHLDVAWEPGEPDGSMLRLTGDAAEMQLHTHLLRSLCPVTGQPDWASLWLHCEGRGLDRVSLLRYLLAYRNHQEFHEQCVERIFRDLSAVCDPRFLHLQAFYTRRGGLDITPFRSTGGRAPLPRLNRQ